MLCVGCSLSQPVVFPCQCGVSYCQVCSISHVCNAEKPLWKHQERAIQMLREAIRQKHKSILLSAPTGAGKNRIIMEVARMAVANGKKVGIFNNRRLLTSQASDVLDAHRVDHGFLAAGMPSRNRAGVQVVSIPTVASRVFAREKMLLPAFDIVFIDEAHANKAETALKIIAHYKQRKAIIVGTTATPVGLGFSHEVDGVMEPLYSHLIIAATNSELRKAGVLVRCDVFAPDEPDMKGVRVSKDGEYVQEAAAQRVKETLVFGNVFSHWRTLNPFSLPTLCFAPGVPESRWLASEFEAQGVPAAHIEAETDDKERKRILAAHKIGDIKVICSYGVLREGVDMPWARHGILIQPCNALSTFLQLVGRLLRADKGSGKDHAVLQDHAGCFYRHGSPNADREWSLEDTDKSLAQKSKKAKEDGLEREPICCPRCNGVRAPGANVCPHCGHEHVMSQRRIRMTDGTLVSVNGSVVKKKQQSSEEQKAWIGCLCRCARSGKTVSQAAWLFRQETGSQLPNGLLHVPASDSNDWKRKIADVFPWTLKRKKRA